MNVVRYSLQFPILAGMYKTKAGEYVSYEDYLHLMGVVRKLRTKIEKKNRRSRKFKEGN